MIRAWYYKDASTGAVDVAPDDLASHRGSGPDDTGLLWVDVDDPTAAEIRSLAEQLGIHHLTAEDLQNAQQRTKLERYGDHYHVALRDCVFDRRRARRTAKSTSSSAKVGCCRSATVTMVAGPAPIDEARDRFERQRGDWVPTTKASCSGRSST